MKPSADRGVRKGKRSREVASIPQPLLGATLPEMHPAICPHCGTRVPAQAQACPACGADELTGWSEAARDDGLDLPDEDFDYEEFTKREFGEASARPRGLHWIWWFVALLLLAGLLLLWLR